MTVESFKFISTLTGDLPLVLISPKTDGLLWPWHFFLVEPILGLNWSLLSSLTVESFELILTLTGKDLPLVLISPKTDGLLWPWYFFLAVNILGLNWSLFRLSSLTTEFFELISTLRGDRPLVLISPKTDELLWPWHFSLAWLCSAGSLKLIAAT